MRNLIIGNGQIGASLSRITMWEVVDIDDRTRYKTYDTLHICFGYQDNFVSNVVAYKKVYKPSLIVIHSTVRLGTTEACGKEAVHSPMRGTHPKLDEGIRTFVKFFGGRKAKEAAEIFEKLGIETVLVLDSRTTEAAKLWDTTQYADSILIMKEIHAYCRAHKVDFNTVYTLFNASYNAGYTKLGRENVMRPVLEYKEGPIRGHCVLPNCRLLNSSTAQRVLYYDE